MLVTVLCAGLTGPAPAQAATGWKYAALGDSLATGAFPLALKGYVPRYRDDTQKDTGRSVSLTIFGQNSWTSTDVLNALRTNGTSATASGGDHVGHQAG